MAEWLEQVSQWHEMCCRDLGHEFQPWSGRTLGAMYFCSKLYLNRKFLHCWPSGPAHLNNISWATSAFWKQ